MIGEFNRYFDRCDYCGDRTIKKYCSSWCKNHADVLRRAVKNKEKMPKSLDKVDESYMQEYVNYLAGYGTAEKDRN